MGSSLHAAHIEPQGRHRGRHTSVPRASTDEGLPEHWGHREGTCVSASGRVRPDHEFLTGWKCIFCDAEVGQDGVIRVKRPPVTMAEMLRQALDPPPEHKPATRAAVARRRRAAVEREADPEVIECGNCAAINEKFFMGREIDHCLACGFNLHPEGTEEDDPGKSKTRRAPGMRPPKRKKGKR